MTWVAQPSVVAVTLMHLTARTEEVVGDVVKRGGGEADGVGAVEGAAAAFDGRELFSVK